MQRVIVLAAEIVLSAIAARTSGRLVVRLIIVRLTIVRLMIVRLMADRLTIVSLVVSL